MDEYFDVDSVAAQRAYARASREVTAALDAVRFGEESESPRRALAVMDQAWGLTRRELAMVDYAATEVSTQQVLALFRARKYASVREHMPKALRLASKFQGVGSPGVQRLRACQREMRAVGESKGWGKRVAKAEARLARAEAKAGAEPLDTMKTANTLAGAYARAYRFEDMTALYERKIRELQRSGADEGSVSAWEYLTADNCLDHGEVATAAALFEQYFTRRLSTYPAEPGVEDVLHQGMLRHEMATYYLYNSQTHDAEPLLRGLLDRLAAIRGRSNSRLATTTLAGLQHQAESSLADCLWMRVKKAEAHKFYRRAHHSLVAAAPNDSLRPVYFHNVVYSAQKWQTSPRTP
jgi:hypothetical protein